MNMNFSFLLNVSKEKPVKKLNVFIFVGSGPKNLQYSFEKEKQVEFDFYLKFLTNET